MIEVINNVFALILLSIFAWAVYESSKMIDEKKQRRKKGLTDYYDNPIVKDK
jgi:accessory gene regulator protein AgrB